MSKLLQTQLGLRLALLSFGAAWGLTVPLSKIAISEGNREFGVIFWQIAFSLICLVAISLYRRKKIKLTKDHFIIFVTIAFVGTLFPATAGYVAIGEIPSGVYAITISLVPMFAMPIAIGLKLEKFEAIRMLGVLLGLCAVVMLVAPEKSLPDPSKAIFVFIACGASLCYAIEDNFVAKFTTRGLSPVQALVGASILGLIFMTPVAIGTGQFVNLNKTWGAPEFAILGIGVLHAFAYTGYVWLVGRAGPVFAAQVAYLVTGFAVFWSILLLGESYSYWVWLAFGIMLMGLFLVQPRHAGTQ